MKIILRNFKFLKFYRFVNYCLAKLKFLIVRYLVFAMNNVQIRPFEISDI